MKLTLVAAAALLSTSMAHAVLVEGTPTPFGTPANPSPRFGTLISFDDVATGSALVANHYAGVGVTSIATTLGPALGYYASSQSGINYVGTGSDVGWVADILVEFSALRPPSASASPARPRRSSSSTRARASSRAIASRRRRPTPTTTSTA